MGVVMVGGGRRDVTSGCLMALTCMNSCRHSVQKNSMLFIIPEEIAQVLEWTSVVPFPFQADPNGLHVSCPAHR